MNQDVPFGRQPIRGEITSADATTAVALVLYKAGVLYTLLSTDDIRITDVFINTDTAMASLDLFDDVSGNGSVTAGERIVGGAFAANGGVSSPFNTPFVCKTGDTPKLKASVAGNVVATFKGHIPL